MRTLSIEAKSRESAESLAAALLSFSAEVIAEDQARATVRVPLSGGPSEIVALLNAIQEYVKQDRGPTVIDLDGRSYLMDVPGQ